MPEVVSRDTAGMGNDDLEIRPLSADRFEDVATLFGEGGDAKWCFCAWYRLRNVDFQKATADSNRAVLERAVDETASEGRHPGLVAYRDGRPIGWVSVGPRSDYARLQHSRVLAPVDDRPAWSIVCFVVSRRARGEGVAQALLEAAVRYAAQHGATLVEAYPVETGGGRVPAASAYKGTVEMFERSGFSVAERRRATRTGPERPIVRREV